MHQPEVSPPRFFAECRFLLYVPVIVTVSLSVVNTYPSSLPYESKPLTLQEMRQPANLTTTCQLTSRCCIPTQHHSCIDPSNTNIQVSQELGPNMSSVVGIDKALGHEREQPLLRHLLRVRVQADHIL
jgi:hypothetical protein